MPAHFVALLHNLLTSLLARFEATGLTQNAVTKRSAKHREKNPEAKRVPTHHMTRHAFPLTLPMSLLHQIDHPLYKKGSNALQKGVKRKY